AVDNNLFVPVLRTADQLALAEVAKQTRDLVTRTRAGQLSPADLDGGTFTISNLGMYDVMSFTAVIHAGQAAILSVGTVPADFISEAIDQTRGWFYTLMAIGTLVRATSGCTARSAKQHP